MKQFVLTKEEKNVLFFVVIAFLLGLTVKIYRDHHAKPSPPKGHEVASSLHLAGGRARLVE